MAAVWRERFSSLKYVFALLVNVICSVWGMLVFERNSDSDTLLSIGGGYCDKYWILTNTSPPHKCTIMTTSCHSMVGWRYSPYLPPPGK